jgi:hypothetical protein
VRVWRDISNPELNNMYNSVTNIIFLHYVLYEPLIFFGHHKPVLSHSQLFSCSPSIGSGTTDLWPKIMTETCSSIGTV